MNGVVVRVLRRLLGLMPARGRERLFDAIFASLPDDRRDVVRRRYHMTDMAWSLRSLKRRGFNPRLIVDVGAFEGQWTEMAKAIFPEAAVLMVEAQSAKSKALEAVVSRHSGSVRLAIALLGAERGQTVAFHEMESGSSVLAEQSNVPRVATSMQTETLDHAAAASMQGPVAFLKLDVQGYEIEVLEGAPRVLGEAEVVLLEAALVPYNLGAPLAADVIRFLDERGFALFDICGMHRQSDLALRTPGDTLVQVDLVFVRKSSPWRPDRFEFAASRAVPVPGTMPRTNPC